MAVSFRLHVAYGIHPEPAGKRLGNKGDRQEGTMRDVYFRSGLLVLGALLVGVLYLNSQNGRYQYQHTGTDEYALVDTRTGEVWFWGADGLSVGHLDLRNRELTWRYGSLREAEPNLGDPVMARVRSVLLVVGAVVLAVALALAASRRGRSPAPREANVSAV